MNELKKEKRHISADLDSAYAAQSTAELKWDSEQINAKVQEVLTSLPEKQQLVFELRYYQDLSFKDIAELTGTSVGALKGKLPPC